MEHRELVLPSVAAALVGLLASCGADAPDAVALLDDLDAGWNTIEPGGDTVCSDGTPYRFFVRPGRPERLLVYFQGGGACWTGATCDPDLDPTYTINVSETDPARANGIFDFANDENPFAQYSTVYAPYCTGDVHLGNRIAAYQSPAVEAHAAHGVTVNHKGMVNARAVLDWVYSRFRAPSSVFVAGSSAGSISSPYFTMLIAEQYSSADIVQLGDGSSGYRREVMTVTPEQQWGTLDELAHLPEFAEIQLGEFTFESLYVAAARRFPDITFAAFDHAEDNVQKQFLALGGHRTNSLLDLIVANQDDIRSEITNFHSYIAGGELHTILQRPEFYSQHVDGVRVRDWVANLANRGPLASIRCSVCGMPEFIGGGE